MRWSHLFVFLFGSLWLSSLPGTLSAPAKEPVLPLTWGDERVRPQAIRTVESIGSEVGALDIMRILARYSGQKITEKLLFAPTSRQPATLYVRLEGNKEYDAYELLHLDCCREYRPSPLLVSR